MEQDNFAKFETDTEEHRQRVQKVGEITLSPEANRREYILASVDALQTHLGRPATYPELDTVMKDVVKYRLWDADNNGTRSEPIIKSVGSVRTEVIHTIGHLSQNGWVNSDGPIIITESGREMLDRFIPVVEPTA